MKDGTYLFWDKININTVINSSDYIYDCKYYKYYWFLIYLLIIIILIYYYYKKFTQINYVETNVYELVI